MKLSCFAWALPIVVLIVLHAPSILSADGILPPVPKVDGKIGEGEYSDCQRILLAAVVGTAPDSGYGARLCGANDGERLYLAVQMENDETVSGAPPLDQIMFFFSSFDLRSRESDEVIETPFGPDAVVDAYVLGVQDNHPLYVDWDSNRGGTVNVVYAVNYASHVFELSQPLCSGEPTDLCLSPGDSVGMCLYYWDFGRPSLSGPVTTADWPAGCGHFGTGSDSRRNAILTIGGVASRTPTQAAPEVMPPATGDAGLADPVTWRPGTGP